MDIEIFGILFTVVSSCFGIWQNRKLAYYQREKSINNQVRSLHNKARIIIRFAEDRKSHDLIKEKAIDIKEEVVKLDIINRNLNIKKINKLEKEGKLNNKEAKEYRKSSSE